MQRVHIVIFAISPSFYMGFTPSKLKYGEICTLRHHNMSKKKVKGQFCHPILQEERCALSLTYGNSFYKLVSKVLEWIRSTAAVSAITNKLRQRMRKEILDHG
jgi:hypothetical protein